MIQFLPLASSFSLWTDSSRFSFSSSSLSKKAFLSMTWFILCSKSSRDIMVALKHDKRKEKLQVRLWDTQLRRHRKVFLSYRRFVESVQQYYLQFIKRPIWVCSGSTSLGSLATFWCFSTLATFQHPVLTLWFYYHRVYVHQASDC